MEELITVRSFPNSVDFEMAKAYLESMGIDCYGRDEYSNRTNVVNVNGGVELQVRKSNLEDTVRLLLEAGYIKETDFEPTGAIKWVDKILSKFRK